MSIRNKLLISLTVVLVVAFVTTSIINYSITREAVREELLNSSLPLTGKNIYSEIHSAMMRPILVSSSMASDAFLKDWIVTGERDVEAITRYLADLHREYGFLTTFFVSLNTQRYYHQRGLHKVVNARDAHDVWFYSFLRSDEKYELSVDTNESEQDTLTIFVNYRVEDDAGNLLGVAGVGVNMNNAILLLNRARQQYGRDVYLVDQDGLVQVHPDERLIRTAYITETPGIATVADAILQAHHTPANMEYSVDGQHMLLSTLYIPEFGWHLVVEQQEAKALGTARQNFLRTLGIGLAALLIIIGICVVTVNHFQRRLEHLARKDPLTGAANRHVLEDRYALSASRAERYHSPCALVLVDLDGFKAINDSQGHLEGDRILQRVVQEIGRHIRPSDMLARWGGDEFIVLLDGGVDEARALAQRIVAAIDASEEIPLTVSCGVGQYEQGDDLDTTIQRADEGLYAVKAAGGNGVG